MTTFLKSRQLYEASILAYQGINFMQKDLK